MKTLFYLFRFVLCLLLLASATSCSVSLLPSSSKPAPTSEAQPSAREARKAFEFLVKYPGFIKAHPELFPRDTVRIKVPYAVPKIEARTQYVPVHDTIYLAQERSQLDSLIGALSQKLNAAQTQAAAAKLHQFIDARPVLRDTLRADTLGVHIRVWLSGRNYQIYITRDAIQGETTGQVVTGGRSPCPALPAPVNYPLYNPAGWGLPWYIWLLIGVVIGAALMLTGARLLLWHLERRT